MTDNALPALYLGNLVGGRTIFCHHCKYSYAGEKIQISKEDALLLLQQYNVCADLDNEIGWNSRLSIELCYACIEYVFPGCIK